MHHEVAAFPSMAFEDGLPDCELVAAAWPDSAQLIVGTWLAPSGDPAAVAGPACAADAATSRKQSENPTAMAPQRLARPRRSRLGWSPMLDAAEAALAAVGFRPIMGLTSDRPFACGSRRPLSGVQRWPHLGADGRRAVRLTFPSTSQRGAASTGLRSLSVRLMTNS